MDFCVFKIDSKSEREREGGEREGRQVGERERERDARNHKATDETSKNCQLKQAMI